MPWRCNQPRTVAQIVPEDPGSQATVAPEQGDPGSSLGESYTNQDAEEGASSFPQGNSKQRGCAKMVSTSVYPEGTPACSQTPVKLDQHFKISK